MKCAWRSTPRGQTPLPVRGRFDGPHLRCRPARRALARNPRVVRIVQQPCLHTIQGYRMKATHMFVVAVLAGVLAGPPAMVSAAVPATGAPAAERPASQNRPVPTHASSDAERYADMEAEAEEVSEFDGGGRGGVYIGVGGAILIVLLVVLLIILL
jgi:hypothetical protein